MNVKDLINKYGTLSTQAKASLWYTVCNILQKGISFMIIPIYTRILTTEEYGKYSVFQSWRDILIIFATLNLYCGVFTKAMINYENDRDRYTSSMQGLSTIITSIMFVIYIYFNEFWNKQFGMSTNTMILMFIYFITYPAFSFWTVRQRVEYKYKRMVIVTLLVSVTMPALSLGLFYFCNLREDAVIWGNLLAQSAVGCYCYIKHLLKSRVIYVKEYWIDAIKFNIPLIPHYLSLVVLGQADRIMIEKYCDSSKAGIYNLAYQVSVIMNVFVNAINGSLVPWTYEQLKKKQYKIVYDVVSKITILVALMTVCIILIAPECIYILGEEQYRSAITIIPSVAMSVYLMFCYNSFSTIEFYFDKTKYVMIASVVGATLNVLLNMLFIPLCGFVAAGYTTLFCYFVFSIMHYVFMIRTTEDRIGKVKIYNVALMIKFTILLLFYIFISLILYKFTLIRYILVVICFIVSILKRKRIIGIINALFER